MSNRENLALIALLKTILDDYEIVGKKKTMTHYYLNDSAHIKTESSDSVERPDFHQRCSHTKMLLNKM